ncbi:VC0807 family protein [Nocardioides insulae]|uniref:VC0807 family protein n=1 Tax=Nocardioides insulae TaxID=394734 RepID=UPI0012F97D9D|nr:VC0807 family protein [Nocardioides insulae]
MPSRSGEEQHPGPRLWDVAIRVVVSLTTAVVVPAVLLWSMLELFNVAVAVIAALAWMVIATGWRYATKRPVSGLLLLTLGVLTIKTAFTLATGNTFVYFIQPVFADLAVAAIFLGSLWTTRPIIARLAPEFYPMSAAVAAQPRVRNLLRRLTLMWGLVVLAKGAITFSLLVTLSTADFVLIKGGAIITLTLTAAIVTIVWALIVGRQQGLIQPK